jgi:hypothetical protein
MNMRLSVYLLPDDILIKFLNYPIFNIKKNSQLGHSQFSLKKKSPTLIRKHQ